MSPTDLLRFRNPQWTKVAALALALLLLPISISLGDQHTEESSHVEVSEWLVAGPVGMAMPAFSEETGVASRKALELSALLPGWPYKAGEAWPEAGAGMELPGAGGVEWEERSGERLRLEAGDGERPRLAWMAFFVAADRFADAELTVSSGHLVRIFFDGEQVAEKVAADASEDDPEPSEEGEGSADVEEETPEDRTEEGMEDETAEPPAPGMTAGAGMHGEGEGAAMDREEAGAEGEDAGTATASLKLTAGKHLVLIATLLDPATTQPWSVAVSLDVKTKEGARAAAVEVSSSPERGVTIRDLLDPPQVAGVAISADGELVAVTLEQPAVPSDDRTSWVEIVRARDGASVRTLRLPVSVSGFTWGPKGHTYVYTTSDAGKATLWIGDFDTGRLEPLLRDVEGLGAMLWAPDGKSLFVQISETAEKDERGVQRMRSLADRWAGFRDLGHIHQVTTGDGTMRRLTAGAFSTTLQDVSADGERLLLSRTRYVAETPFVHGELFELDLDTLEVGAPHPVVWLGGASYSPIGDKVMVLAGPSAFGDVGMNLGDAEAPNEYDGQVYLLEMADDPAEDRVIPLTRDFDPAVNDAVWSHLDYSLFLLTTDTTFGRIYRWQPSAMGEAGVISPRETSPDVVSSLAVARNAPALAYTGSSLQEPEAAFVMSDLFSAGAPTNRTIHEPAAADFEQVRFGRVEEFSFTSAEGEKIPGVLYFPLDYEEGRKYPLLTYYYGGVVPTTRSFAGRYPKNFWAANGYAVYVLQPSGAVGFGQERSATHPNDWGQRVVQEIVAGVDAVVAAHPFLDGSKVGCFGGSYGGFLTQRLVTDSDRFAAAISHAGISNISSYWGEGWWGFLYMATAAHGSYPWSRPDVFIEQSPLFKADQIETPLLLLHGTVDPNVPPGESEQMFAALRVLGKEVEYVRIDGEGHWILTYPKRVLWWQTVLAWFDRYLKDEPEWWEELWGEELEYSGP